MAKKHGGHHGGSWKVAYADFVTAMMALFLCLWLTAQDSKIKDAVERAFRNPFAAVTKESVGIIPSENPAAPSTPSKGDFNSVSAVEMSMIKKITEDLAKMLQQSEDSQNSVQLEMLGDGLRMYSPPTVAGFSPRSRGRFRATRPSRSNWKATPKLARFRDARHTASGSCPPNAPMPRAASSSATA